MLEELTNPTCLGRFGRGSRGRQLGSQFMPFLRREQLDQKIAICNYMEMSSDDDAPSFDPHAAAAIERAGRRLAMLRELAELGTRMTRELVERAAAAPADAEPRHNPAESFARVSRAVRLTLALEAKIDQDLAALRDGPAVAASDAEPAVWVRPDQSLRKGQPSAHRNRIRDNVWDAINRQITDLRPAHEILDALHERLTEGERYDAFVFLPLRESVEAICADLGLTPDWSRWTDDGFPHDAPSARYDWPDLWRYNAENAAHRRRNRAEANAASQPGSAPLDPHRRERTSAQARSAVKIIPSDYTKICCHDLARRVVENRAPKLAGETDDDNRSTAQRASRRP